MIEREKKVTIGEKTFIVKFPNVGQLISLESIKQALTDNRYGQMASSGVSTMYYALDLVDTAAWFQVCSPEILKFYDVRSLMTVDSDVVEKFLKVYSEQIRPWFESTLKELRNVGSDDNGQATAGDTEK